MKCDRENFDFSGGRSKILLEGEGKAVGRRNGRMFIQSATSTLDNTLISRRPIAVTSVPV